MSSMSSPDSATIGAMSWHEVCAGVCAGHCGNALAMGSAFGEWLVQEIGYSVGSVVVVRHRADAPLR